MHLLLICRIVSKRPEIFRLNAPIVLEVSFKICSMSTITAIEIVSKLPPEASHRHAFSRVLCLIVSLNCHRV